MIIYRDSGGNFDNWKRYVVKIDDDVVSHVSSASIVEIDVGSSAKCISFAGSGGLFSDDIPIIGDRNQCLYIKRTANPRIERPSIRYSWIDEAELAQRVTRFDKPPYKGNKTTGLVIALFASLLFGLGAIVVVVSAIAKAISQPEASTYIVVALIICILGPSLGFISASGLRGIFYYLKFPKRFR